MGIQSHKTTVHSILLFLNSTCSHLFCEFMLPCCSVAERQQVSENTSKVTLSVFAQAPHDSITDKRLALRDTQTYLIMAESQCVAC